VAVQGDQEEIRNESALPVFSLPNISDLDLYLLDLCFGESNSYTKDITFGIRGFVQPFVRLKLSRSYW
jgi:hypothetical protein